MAVKLSTLIGRLDAIAQQRPYWLQVASEKMAAKALQLVDEGFAQRRDPYGEPWRETQQPNPILERTSALRHGWSVLGISTDGFRMDNTQPYAPFHQSGTRTIHIRRMVPTRARGLGPIWGPPLKAIAADALRGALLG